MKCEICDREVKSKGLYKRDSWQINGAVIGDYIKIVGHKQCCEAVDNLVVIPNRMRLTSLKAGQEAKLPVSYSLKSQGGGNV